MARDSRRQQWAAYVAGRGSAGRKSPAVPASLGGAAFRGKVLGIDPSLRGSGFAVLEHGPDRSPRLLETATLRLARNLSLAECLGAIAGKVSELLERHPVRHVALEQTIYVQNFQTAQILGAARGAAIAAAALAGREVFEYPPLRVKQAVVGAGRASKEQVARTVRGLTGSDLELRFDESDAAAVALCHAFTWRGPDAAG
jgi:crossover junction endodeoxyribonuclease RuvC